MAETNCSCWVTRIDTHVQGQMLETNWINLFQPRLLPGSIIVLDMATQPPSSMEHILQYSVFLMQGYCMPDVYVLKSRPISSMIRKAIVHGVAFGCYWKANYSVLLKFSPGYV